MAKYPVGSRAGICWDCGGSIEPNRHEQTLRCNECSRQAIRMRCRAVSAVRHAIARGDLPFPQHRRCVDCGEQANHYDHRDYRKPLEVEPVCRSCNFNRGPAVWRNYAEA